MRRIVYKTVYSSSQLAPAMMVFRSLEIAFRDGFIKERFFYRDDNSAVEFLTTSCGPEPGILMNKVLHWQWYPEAYCYESIKEIAVDNHWASRSELANYLCSELKVPQNAICVYMGKGRDVKSITLPIIKDNGEFVEYNPIEGLPIYRVKVFVRPDLSEHNQRISELTKEKLSIS
jgi:hypothetical protein